MRQMMRWRGNELYLRRRRVASIEQDTRWPSLWRVQLPDGTLSDVVNLTRAKDAAYSLAAEPFYALDRARKR